MDEPLVTIGMPVFNGARFVEQAIRSLLAQTFGDFVLLISDNCSTDATPEICARLALEDPRIRLVRQGTNVGMTRNFEYVLRAARTPLFMWASHDDLWAPDFLAETLGLLDRNPDAIGAMTAIGFVDEAGDEVLTHRIPNLMASRDLMTRVRSVKDGGCHAVYSLFRRDMMPAAIKPELIPAPDEAFVYGLSLYGPFALSERVLMTQRHIGYSLVRGPNGRLVREKALGPEGILYSQRLFPMCRVMWAYTSAAPIRPKQKALLDGHVFRAWLVRPARHRALERTSRARVEEAWADGRRLRALLLVLSHGVLRPRRALREARDVLGRWLGRS